MGKGTIGVIGGNVRQLSKNSTSLIYRFALETANRTRNKSGTLNIGLLPILVGHYQHPRRQIGRRAVQIAVRRARPKNGPRNALGDPLATALGLVETSARSVGPATEVLVIRCPVGFVVF